jgi:hypothetical protein
MKNRPLLFLAFVVAACGSGGESAIEDVAPPIRDASFPVDAGGAAIEGGSAATDASSVDAAGSSVDAAGSSADAAGSSVDAAGAAVDAASRPVDATAAVDAGPASPDAGADAGVSCSVAGACSLLDPCSVGAYRCNDAGAPVCVAVGAKPNGSFCGFGQTCQAGVCVQGVPTEDVVLIAKYVESAFFKALVLWNPGARAIDLARYGLCLQSNQYTNCNWSVMLSGSLAPNGTFVLCNGTASPDTQCDVKNTDVINFNGDDRVGLYFDVNQNARVDFSSDLRVDHFGEPGVQPPTQIWADKTYRRHKCTPYLGGQGFDVAAWYDDVSIRAGDAGTFQPDRTTLRAVPACR